MRDWFRVVLVCWCNGLELDGLWDCNFTNSFHLDWIFEYWVTTVNLGGKYCIGCCFKLLCPANNCFVRRVKVIDIVQTILLIVAKTISHFSISRVSWEKFVKIISLALMICFTVSPSLVTIANCEFQVWYQNFDY